MADGTSGTGINKCVDSCESFCRPVQSILEFIGLRVFIPAWSCIGRSALAMRSVFVSLLVWMFILAVLALHFFMGVLEYRCVASKTQPVNKGDIPIEDADSEDVWTLCGFEPGSRSCPPYQKCVANSSNNPDYGYQNFNDFGWTYLMTVRLATLDFWEDTYRNLLLTKGLINIWYFPIITFGSSCFLALFFAVIFKKYASRQKFVERKGFNFFKTDAVGLSANPPDAQGCWGRTTDMLCLWNCCPCWQVFSGALRKFIFHPVTETLTALIIIVNVYLFAVDHSDLDDAGMIELYRHWEISLCIFFLVEAVIKILALSPKGYFSVSWNIFEFCVAILNAFEIFSRLSAFFISPRLILFFRLGRYWPSLNFLFAGLGRCMKAQFQFILIYGAFFAFLAWVGSEILGLNYVKYEHLFRGGEVPRWNFTDMMHSFMVIFRMLCGEWVETMYDCMRVNGLGSLLFYFPVLLIGKYVMVNVFIAFMIGEMESTTVENTSKDQSVDDIGKAVERIEDAFTSVKQRLCKSRSSGYTKDGDETATLHFEEELPATNDSHRESVVSEKRVPIPVKQANPYSTVDLDIPPDCFSETCCNCINTVGVTPAFWNSLRDTCLKVSQNWVFDLLVLIVVIIGCIPIAIHHYESVQEAVGVMKFLMVIAICVPVLFVLEMTIKLFGYGYSFYFQSGWRSVDFVIVLIVFVNMLTFQTQAVFFKIIQSLQVFRLFRAFRYLIYFQPFRVVVNTLLGSVPGAINMLIIGCMMWLSYAILCVQVFMDQFHYCVDRDGNRLHYMNVSTKDDCWMKNHTWLAPNLGFDNIFQSAISLFHVGTFKGWIEVIHSSVDALWVGYQPMKEIGLTNALFFFLFISHVTVFIYSTLNSLLLDALNRSSETNCKERYQGSRIYENILQYIDSKTLAVSELPTAPFRAFLHQLTSSLPFKLGVGNCIIAGVIVMACYDAHGSEVMKYGLNCTYVVLVVVFSWELVARLLATHHPLNFFCSFINALDFVAFILAVADVSSSGSVSFYVLAPPLLRLPRLAEIFWTLRFSRIFLGLRRVWLTLSRSMTYIASVFLIVFTLILLYSIIGVNVFHNLNYLPNENFLYNFESVGHALLIMFQISTTAGFDPYYIAMSSRTNCDMYDETHSLSGCGHPLFGPLFLFSFIAITYICLTLIPVIIIKQYKEACDYIRLGLAPDDLEEFYASWAEFDPMGQGFMPYKNLPDFLDSLSGALRLKKPNSCQIAVMDVPVYSGQHVYHREVLARLARRRILQWGYRIDPADEPERAMAAPDMEAISSTLWRAHEEKCATKIQTAWRTYKKNAKRKA